MIQKKEKKVQENIRKELDYQIMVILQCGPSEIVCKEGAIPCDEITGDLYPKARSEGEAGER